MTKVSSAVASIWSTSVGEVRRPTAAFRSVVLGRSSSVVAIFWSTSAPDCLARSCCPRRPAWRCWHSRWRCSWPPCCCSSPAWRRRKPACSCRPPRAAGRPARSGWPSPEAGAQGRQTGLVRGQLPFGCREVGSQRVVSQVRRARQPGHFGLQHCHCGGVGGHSCGVGPTQ